MATASLVPVSTSDPSANILSGAFTDIDNTIAIPSGVAVVSVPDAWTGGGLFSFGLTDVPGDYSSFTSIKFEIRARVTGGVADDTVTYTCSIQGTNAPSDTVTWVESDDGAGYAAKTFTNSAVTPSAANINGWTAQVAQTAFLKTKGADGLTFETDEIECILTYVASVGGANPKGPLGMVLHGALGGPIG